MDKETSCFSDNSGCCIPKQEKKVIMIYFLYLDLSICERCQGTESKLDEAINEAFVVLNAAGYDIVVDKINITSKEMAVKYEFVSSPTIRINGNDIALEVKESDCTDCGDLCGDNVDCRVWTYNGVEYSEPPKALIVNALLKEIYNDKQVSVIKEEYKLPQNLENFFEALKNK